MHDPRPPAESLFTEVDGTSPKVNTRDLLSSMEIEPGQRILQYELIREIGRGGMGVVYLARDTMLARRVAIKLLWTDNPEHAQRLLFEGRAIARCTHENIVVVYEIDERDSVPFMVLEYLEGRSLAQILPNARLSWKRAIAIMIEVVRALICAHEQAIVHRDLKPANIFLTDAGPIKVLDFGIAQVERLPEAELARISLTEPLASQVVDSHIGHLIGTVPYMSPEQIRSQDLDGRSDLWAVGIILYEMLVGRHPFEGTPKINMILKIVEPKPMPGVSAFEHIPPDVTAIIERCLQKDRKDRYESAEALLAALEAAAPLPELRGVLEAHGPYPGLSSFEESDANRYFGRSRDTAHVVGRLKSSPFVCLTGPTGVGKSSFVLAGIIPTVQQEQHSWRTYLVRPGRQPLRAFARLIDPDVSPSTLSRIRQEPGYLGTELRQRARNNGCKILIAIDPFEELYTLTDSVEDRRAFTACLSGIGDDASSPLRLLIAIRSDFLDRLSEDRALMTAAARTLVLLGPPERAGLIEALEQPAKMAGYRFENDALIDEILNAVETTPHSLPLLQFTAQRLWEARDQERKTLTAQSYTEMGGLIGALTGHADRVVADIARFSPHALDLTKVIFRMLVTSDRTRALVPISHLHRLDNVEEVQALLDRLVEARLLVAQSVGDATGATIELIHDSLIHNWAQLKSWIESDQEEQRFLTEIGQAADLWAQRGQNPQEVWTGPALAEAERMLDRCTGPIPPSVQQFVQAGQRQQQQRLWRRRMLVTLTIAGLLVGLLVVLIQRQEAVRQREVARIERATAQRESSTSAFSQGDMLKAKAELRSSLESRDALMSRVLWWKLEQNPILWRKPVGTIEFGLSMSPDGTRFAVPGFGGLVRIYQLDIGTTHTLRTPSLLTNSDASSDALVATGFSPNARLLAGITNSVMAHVWDLETQKLVSRFRIAPRFGRQAASSRILFDISGSYLVSNAANEIMVWDVRDPSSPALINTIPVNADSISMHPKKYRIIAGVRDRIIVFNVTNRNPIFEIKVPSAITDLAVSHDGTLVATRDRDNHVRVWSLESKTLVQELTPSQNRRHKLAFSMKDRWLVVGSLEGDIHLFDPKTGTRVGRYLAGHNTTWLGAHPSHPFLVIPERRNTVNLAVLNLERLTASQRARFPNVPTKALAFDPSGQQLLSGGEDGSIRFWDIDRGSVEKSFGEGDPIRSIETSSTGHRIGWTTNDLNLVNTDGVETIRNTFNNWGPYDLSFHPHAPRLAAGIKSKVWTLDISTKPALRPLEPNAGYAIKNVSYDPTGQFLSATARSIFVWKAGSGQLIKTLSLDGDIIHASQFDPTGQFIISVDKSKHLRRWDWAQGTHQVIGKIPSKYGWHIDISQDGNIVGVPGAYGSAYLWSVPEQKMLFKLRGHEGPVTALRFGPNDKYVATSGVDGTVRLFDPHTGQPVWRAPALLASTRTLASHRGFTDMTTGHTRPHSKTAWENAVQNAFRAVEIPDTSDICLGTYDGQLEIWDRTADRRTHFFHIGPMDALVATPHACITISKGRAWALNRRSGARSPLIRERAHAVATHGDEILVATKNSVLFIDHHLALTSSIAFDSSVVAMAASSRVLIVGFRDGGLEVIGRTSGAATKRIPEDTPSSTVRHIVLGPAGTVIVGYQNGTVGLWHLKTGRLLKRNTLHGAVIHLAYVNGHIDAATDLGDHLTWNLTAIDEPYCKLLNKVWKNVPIELRAGRIVRTPIPRDHSCYMTATPEY